MNALVAQARHVVLFGAVGVCLPDTAFKLLYHGVYRQLQGVEDAAHGGALRPHAAQEQVLRHHHGRRQGPGLAHGTIDDRLELLFEVMGHVTIL